MLIIRSENETQPITEKANREVRRAPSFSGPLMLPTRASANSLSAPIKSSGGNQFFKLAFTMETIILVLLLVGKSYCIEYSPLLGYRDSLEEKSKANLVQIKGRFSVTSENVDLVKVLAIPSIILTSRQPKASHP